MANHLTSRFCTTLGLLLFFAIGGPPLRAQLDPRLQSTPTDFMDLYQQSSNAKLKPEIVTLFDFSGSMEALMFHPAYRNKDIDDSGFGNKTFMSFELHEGTPGVPGNNTYTIRAQARGCNAASSTYVVNVNSTGSVGVNTGPRCGSSNAYTITARGKAASTDNQPVVTVGFTVGIGPSASQINVANPKGYFRITQSNGTTTTNPINITSNTGNYNSGSIVTFTAYKNRTGSQGTNQIIEWSSDGATFTDGAVTGSAFPYRSQWTWTIPTVSAAYEVSNISPGTTTFTAGTSVTFNASLLQHGSDTGIDWYNGTTLIGSGTSINWTVPTYDPGTQGGPYVTADVGRGTCNQLVKPNGSVVTKADADAASGSSLYGVSYGSDDVRNWVRAASHARFVYTDTTVTPNVTRTIDIPIPWKVLDQNSTGNPLSSMTVNDAQKSQTNLDGTTTSWGSGQDIEVDKAWRVGHGSEMLDGDEDLQTTTTLRHIAYHNVYVRWLFTGKYTDGTYAGKYIVYDAANASIVGGQGNVNWGQGFGSALLTSSPPTITVPTYGEAINADPRPYLNEVTLPAAKYRTPSRNRVQAVKEAAIRTWITNQNDVLWAFRFIGNGVDSLNPSTTSGARTSEPDDSGPTYGTDRAWYLLNGSSLAGMNRIAYFLENTNTPLTYATARTFAQFTDPSSVFNAVETGANKPSTCQSHYLILFTDGRDNVGNLTNYSPYLDSTTLQGSALSGNRSLLSTNGTTNLSQGDDDDYWNVYTYSAIAAHLADSSIKEPDPSSVYWNKTLPTSAANPVTYPTSGWTYANMLPYSIIQRGSGTNMVDFRAKPHRITTMTVGVSLGGSYIEANTPKYILFATAAVGDPSQTTWNLTTLKPFESEPHPQIPGYRQKKAGTTYFFDGYDPDSLIDSLQVAVQQTLIPTSINTAANPNLPFIGSSFGKQIYLGKFQPPPNGGAVWSGDLFMFGTKEVNSTIQLVDEHAQPVSSVDRDSAVWSASDALDSRLWSSRRLFTRIPGGTALHGFSDIGTDYTDSTSGLQNYVATSFTGTDADTRRRAVIQYAAGGSTASVTAPARPAANRSDLMGDIINSGPTALEYKFSDLSLSGYSRLSGVGGNRFRLILVGTNQGWLHAFGEVTKITTLASPEVNAGQEVVTGQVDELWAFMPTDFLANLNYITQSGNTHRFMVDGTPQIYFLDLPASAGGVGDGILEQNSDATKAERAIAIIGLRKGGRSYYALDIHDPFNPSLKWSLVPDEAASIPTSRNKTGLSDAVLQGIVANMGFSTCTPAIGRVLFNGVMKDVVFLGGGFSTPEVDHNFPVFPSPPASQSTPLGRSVIALDVNTGDILAAADMSDATKFSTSTTASRIGPIGAGLVPFEFFLNSGLAQRAYFLDYKGGLWSWGSKQVSATAPYVDFRKDSSDLAKWTLDGAAHADGTSAGIRKVAQDTDTVNGALYTTRPAPFLVSNFPGLGKTGSANPVAVGIAMVSGDRNNPLDRNYTTGSGGNRPVRHRLTVVFDRQDSRAWNLDTASGPDTGITDSDLQAFSSTISSTPTDKCADTDWKFITPGCSDYYLAPWSGTPRVYGKPKFGFYVNFPDGAIPANQTNFFIPKGVNTPTVNSGHIFYSVFTPDQGDICSGGSGATDTYYIANAINPIVNDARGANGDGSGKIDTWTGGIASDFFGLGTRGVIQGGAIKLTLPPNTAPSTSRTSIELHTYLGDASSRFPKLRVWRTVH